MFYDRQQTLRMINMDPVLTREYLSRTKEAKSVEDPIINRTLLDMFVQYVMTPNLEEINEDGDLIELESEYKKKYDDLAEEKVRNYIPLTEPTPEVKEIIRLINIKGWKRFMNQIADYAKHQTAVLNNAGSMNQEDAWRKLEKEFRKIARMSIAT